MNQDMLFSEDSTNYLTQEKFDELMWGLQRLEPFTSETGRPPMSAQQYYVLFRILYGCGLRVGEGLKLMKKDFDLQHRILKLWDAKTGKGKYQKTTILPTDIELLTNFVSKFDNEETLLFPTNRQNVWRYAKDAGRLAGLDIFEEHDTHNVEGVWTHLFRKSCAKNMRNKGASIELVSLKLRHKLGAGNAGGGRVTYVYTMPDLNALLQWEKANYPVNVSQKVERNP